MGGGPTCSSKSACLARQWVVFQTKTGFLPLTRGARGRRGGPPLLLLVAMGKLDAVPRDLDSDSLTPARGARLYTRRGGGFSSPGLLS